MRVVVISGYFNPLHTGHLDYIKGALELGDRLVVIINNDQQVELKGATPFMKEADRMRIVSAIKGVDRVVLSIDTDSSVVQTIRFLYNEYAVNWDFDDMTFANGGDRTIESSPEEAYCNWRKIKTVYSVGGNKTQSSSGLIDNATKNVDKDKE
jgi:cytidyltransferase-like protein